MRQRVFQRQFKSSITSANGLPDVIYSEGFPGKMFSIYGYEYPTDYESISTMDDALTSPGLPRSFNPCKHEKMTAAVFGGDYIGYTYSPPTPPCHVYVSQAVGYKPGLISPNVNWGGALDDLAAQVSGSISDSWMAAVTLIELRQTIQMIRNPFNLLKPTWRRRVSKIPAGALALKRAAGVWLENQYGWQSMFNDVTTASKALAKVLTSDVRSRLEDVAERFSVSGRQTESRPSTIYLNGDEDLWNTLTSGGMPSISAGGLVQLHDVETFTQWRLGCRRLTSATQAYSRTQRLLSAANLSNWRSIRDTIWEVIPFSFVIDWFVDSRGIWRSFNQERLSRADIKDLGVSIKQHTTYGASCALGFPLWPYYGTSQWGYRYPTECHKPVSRCTTPGSFSYYERTPGFPPVEDVDSIFLNRGLSRLQCLSGVSLLIQRALTLSPT